MHPIKAKRLNAFAILPIYAHAGDAGADIYSTETCTLQPLERKAISTGISVEIPPHYEIQVRPKSGLALKHGITVLNTPGTIDSGYRGEIKVILVNLGSEPYTVQQGQKIAQLVCSEVTKVLYVESQDLVGSDRGEGGFSSTGIGIEKPMLTPSPNGVGHLINLPEGLQK